MITMQQQAKLWHLVQRGDDDECWPWKGDCYITNGVKLNGRMMINGSSVPVRNLIYQIYRGVTLPPRARVRQICKNLLCCNPLHLQYNGRAKPASEQEVNERLERLATEIKYLENALEEVSVEQYITWDYVDGWIGVRCEPKDPARALAMTNAIPAEDRKFLSHKRLWIFRPKHLAAVLAIVDAHCPDYPTFLESPHQQLLAVALQVASGRGTASALTEASIPPRPEGTHVGTLEDLLGRW